jgi:hypothetical protein
MNDKNELEDSVSQKGTKKLTEKYSDSLPLRLIIQNIPYIGSSLDTVLSETGNKWREKRLQTLLQNLDEKIKTIDVTDDKIISEIQQRIKTEDFYDLFLQAVQKSALAHKEEKIKRFANLLKNFLINDTSAENYLIQVFINITDELTEIEIEKLSNLQSNEIEVYYNYQDKPFDIKRYISDVSERKIRIDDIIPQEYDFDNLYIYAFNRLEKLDLIKIETIESMGGSFHVGWKTSNQSAHSSKNYKRKDRITLSEFGKRYIDWILK